MRKIFFFKKDQYWLIEFKKEKQMKKKDVQERNLSIENKLVFIGKVNIRT